MVVEILNAREDFELLLFNSAGKMLHTQQVKAGDQLLKLELDLHSYPAGLYLINLRVGDQYLSKRLLKQ